MSDSSRLSTALLLSILLHAVLVAFLSGFSTIGRSGVTAPPLLDIDLVPAPVPPKQPAPAAPAPIPVPPAPAPEPPPEPAVEKPAEEPPAQLLPLPEQQIVSPSEGGEERPPEKTRFLSDRDSTVKEQSIRRGEPEPGPEPPPEKVARAEPAGKDTGESKPAQQKRGEADRQELAALPKLPGLDELLPNASRLATEGYGRPQEAESPSEKTQEAHADLLKYGDAWRAARTRPGALDFLPDVREGDITLLNTKAELFSPFVRRVAVRVFGHLVILLRRTLDGVSTSSQEWVSIEAVMNKHGDLTSLEVKDRSSSSVLGLDRSLQRACYEGFFDRNPPNGAEAEDGQIHFVLHIRVASVAGPNGRSLGYSGLFSAGLL